MILCKGKRKKETVHFSHLQYYDFIFIQLTFTLFSFSYCPSVYCLFYLSPQRTSAMHSQMQFTSALFINDCHFNLKASHGIYGS